MTFKNTAAALIECHLDDECHRMYPPAIRCAAAHTIAPSLPHAVAIEAQISTFFSYFPHPQTNETKSEAARATTRLIEGFPRSSDSLRCQVTNTPVGTQIQFTL